MPRPPRAKPITFTFAQYKEEVIKKVKQDPYNKMLRYLRHSNPSLWGEIQEGDYLQQNLVLTLYHDLFGKGYQRVLKDLSPKLTMSHNSLKHNASKIRKVLSDWGGSTVILGTVNEWEAAMRHIAKLPASMKDISALLYQDSSDFKIQHGKGRGKTSEHWSGKEHHPARRFQFIRNARGKLIKVWGGYSPKIEDSVFLDFKRKYIEKHFAGADIVADTHYSVGKKMFEHVKYWTPVAEKRASKQEDEVIGLSKVQTKRNNDIHKVRARVEHPFAYMKNMFKSFTVPWGEDPVQLDYLVWMAVGIYNVNKV